MFFPDVLMMKNKIFKKNIRGEIYDRNGNILATSIKSTSLSINPKN